MDLKKIKNDITPYTTFLLELYCSKFYNKKIQYDKIITFNYLPQEICTSIFNIMIEFMYNNNMKKGVQYFYKSSIMIQNYISFGKVLHLNKKSEYNEKINYIILHNNTNRESTNY